MIEIEGFLKTDVKIQGQSVPFATMTNVMVVVCVNWRRSLPEIQLSVTDTANVFGSIRPVNDGVKIEVDFNNQQTDTTKTVTFVSVGSPNSSPNPISSSARDYRIVGLLENNKYIRSNPRRSFNGNSHQVLKQIADQCDLKFFTDFSGNDNMTWLPMRSPYSKFASNIALRAWANDTSCSALGVQEDGTMHFRNLTAAMEQSPKFTFYRNTSINPNGTKAVQYLNYLVISRSGLLNYSNGYPSETTRMSLTGSIENRENVRASRSSDNFDMNSAFSRELREHGRIFMAPSDTGNTHRRYTQAKHQNNRLRATYGHCIHILTQEVTDVKLFDVGNFILVDSEGQEDTMLSGKYIVTGYSRAIVNNFYRERIELTNCGPNGNTGRLL